MQVGVAFVAVVRTGATQAEPGQLMSAYAGEGIYWNALTHRTRA